MDWRSVKFDWNRARAFYITVEEGSLSAAAKALALSQPTVSRQVMALEEELNTVLFERVGKGLELTPTGKALYEHVKSMAEAASRFSLSAAGIGADIEGKVCISATEMTAFFTLPPILAQLQRIYPKILVELVVNNASSDLKRREADIAIRAYRPEQPDLIIRKLNNMTVNLYASKQYVAQNQALFDAGRVSDAKFVGFGTDDEFSDILRKEFGLEVDHTNFSAYTTNHMVNWQLAKQHMGISGMLKEVGDNDTDMVAIFSDEQAVTGDLYLVSHRELRASMRIQRVFDYLANALG